MVIDEIIKALANIDQPWQVLLCPEEFVREKYAVALACALPPGSLFGGRTALLPTGNRISVVNAEDTDIPKKHNFTITLVGWHCTKPIPGVAKWVKASKHGQSS